MIPGIRRRQRHRRIRNDVALGILRRHRQRRRGLAVRRHRPRHRRQRRRRLGDCPWPHRSGNDACGGCGLGIVGIAGGGDDTDVVAEVRTLHRIACAIAANVGEAAKRRRARFLPLVIDRRVGIVGRRAGRQRLADLYRLALLNPLARDVEADPWGSERNKRGACPVHAASENRAGRRKGDRRPRPVTK